jgi:5-(carboxyamino)imidazole ribonucleotide synthase
MQKAGILGGGQLGRMLLQEAANYPVETYVLENDPDCPAAHLCHHFIKGDIRNFDDVYNFGKDLDVITIEIESVNVDALEKLAAEGRRVIPTPAALRIIKNKVSQKAFYTEHSIPTAAYRVVQSMNELQKHIGDWLPAVQKIGEGGYDGRGVQVIMSVDDAAKGFDSESVLEKKVAISKEIAVIVAVAEGGDTALYPPVEMIFDPYLNLLNFQIAPADVQQNMLWRIQAVARTVAKQLSSPGIFAVEMFISKEGELYVNETAPRVHNSGHHTIEANYSSQYDMLWRILLNYPLGNPASVESSSLVNLLGEPGHTGEVKYEGLEEVLKMENVFVHLYGKKQTKPGRKMGHVTIMSKDKQDLVHKAQQIRHALKVVAH